MIGKEGYPTLVFQGKLVVIFIYFYLFIFIYLFLYMKSW